ncbi:mitochondrial coenzyme A diphosphatase NUDT8 isoform X2 [Spea bombifrons]|uniref:mitochondrial coenzyme A diphosphatase NUDT8 isoform X2 n=1 Tax=Spea bombifrons TaxID=233779 RepID=UPI00234915F5|nr:mitochondrial coenzyme A diphosphatase NUDT8 isoform X2 [Spea bombifrons]
MSVNTTKVFILLEPVCQRSAARVKRIYSSAKLSHFQPNQARGFSYLPNYDFSHETEQRCRETLSRTTVPKVASAGVLVTLCSLKGVPSFLYTLRSSQLRGRHKGDVSFPGGKRDASDRDIVHTALREAQEELGVTLSPDLAWGPMKPITDWTGMVIVPVLANIGPLEDLAPNPNPKEEQASSKDDYRSTGCSMRSRRRLPYIKQ